MVPNNRFVRDAPTTGFVADPFQNPPPYEKLVGDLAGNYTRRINIQQRLVYEVFAKERVVLRMWSHYE